jgi:hypothetical protein
VVVRFDRWTWPAGVALIVTAGLVAGCGSSSPHAAATTTTTVPATPTSAAPPTTPTTPAAPTTTVAAASTTTVAASTTTAVHGCTTAQLSAHLGSPNGTAGASDYTLSFDNTASVPCSLQGYPGVSFVAGADGHQVGAAARRLPSTALVVILAPGGVAEARVSVADAGNFPTACERTAVLGLRVYPPDNTRALFVAHPDQTCAAPAYVTLGVGPVRPA